MTQVLATSDFEVDFKDYTKGQVIDFADAGQIAHLAARGVVNRRAADVAAAVVAGATQLVHSAGTPASDGLVPMVVNERTRQLTTTAAQEAVRGAAGVRVPNRPWLTKGLFCGRLLQQANAADHTSHIEFTFEAEPGTIQVGVLNNVATALTGVKVALAFSAASAVKDASTLATLNGGTWTNVPFGGSTSGANIAAAPATNSVDNPEVTWSDVVSVVPVARADGSPLVVGHVRVEIPAANTTIPVGAWDNIGELEDDGSEAIAPFGRFRRGRAQAVAGVTTRANFTSTASTGKVVPVLIRYTPRNGAARGYTVAVFGNSLFECTVSAPVSKLRAGWIGRVQRDISTATRPVEFVGLAIHGSAASRTYNRVQTLLSKVLPELFVMPVGNINSATYPGASAAQALTDINGVRNNHNLARHAAAESLAVPIFVLDPPANFAARSVVEFDKQRIKLNEEYKARQSKRELVCDFAGPFSGPVDANGQTTIKAGLTDDNLHDNDAGSEVWAAEMVTTLANVIV